jgi:hypothetical protein
VGITAVFVGVFVDVFVGTIAVLVGVFVDVLVGMTAVLVGVLVAVGVAGMLGVGGTAVLVGVLVAVGVAGMVDVGVFVGVLVAVGVAGIVGVGVLVGVFVAVGVAGIVGVEVGHSDCPATIRTSSTYQPSAATLLSVPSRKRNLIFCPANEVRLICTWTNAPPVLPDQACLPWSGLLQHVDMVAL